MEPSPVRSLEAWHRRIISGEAVGPAPAVARGVLWAGSVGYRIAVDQINHRYERKTPTFLTHPTISVGNLTAGGTGKTPTAAALAQHLLQEGRRPAILSRGHGKRPGELGDELTLLSESLGPDVPVAANADRSVGAAEVLARHEDVDTFLLDDGFQHRKVGRDFDLVLIDVSNPFGHNHLLPRGLLREPLRALARADHILLTRCDLGDAGGVEQVVRDNSDAPISRSTFEIEVAEAVGRQAVAACGIGNPDAFFQNLRQAGVEVVRELIYKDHHNFTAADAKSIASNISADGVAVVTGKDWIKLRHVWPAGAAVVVAGQHLVLQAGATLLDDVVRAARRPKRM